MTTLTPEATEEIVEIGDEEPRCEIQFMGDPKECGRPASFITKAHNISCQNQACLMCSLCLLKLTMAGAQLPTSVCPACFWGPIVWDVRPL